MSLPSVRTSFSGCVGQLIRLLTLLWLCLAMISPAHGQDGFARVAAAADLRFALDDILERFHADHPDHRLEVVYGSSGRFRTQIAHGAPFDLYFSADRAYPEALSADGLVQGEVIPYALGRLVVWRGDAEAPVLTLDELDSTDIRRIAIANPRHAPYGARAEEALRAAGLWSELSPRLVYGENIAHTMQLVQSGAAEAGIIALSLALNPSLAPDHDYYLIDDALHSPLDQGFVLTRRAADNATARRFADYMQTESARAIMRAYGFELPDH